MHVAADRNVDICAHLVGDLDTCLVRLIPRISTCRRTSVGFADRNEYHSVEDVMRLPPMTMPVLVKFWGRTAAFNRPEFPSERISYMVPTPSAVRGMLEAIYWKPEFHWRVREIRVLNPIRWFSETRNEIDGKATRAALRGPLVVDGTANHRFQRMTRCLYDVAYVVVAETVPNDYSLDELEKHTHIFNERTRIGRYFSAPYFGCREHAAYFDMCDGTEKPHPVNLDLGRMAFDQNFVDPGTPYAERHNSLARPPVPVYFEARLVDGVVKVPDELYEVCGGCRAGRRQPPLPE